MQDNTQEPEHTPEFYKAFYEKNRIALMQYENLREHFSEVRVALMQYGNLREHFSKVVESVLGKDYYNMGMDVYVCDAITCKDIIYKANRPIIERILDKIFS